MITAKEHIDKCRIIRKQMDIAYKTGRETDGEEYAKKLHLAQLEALKELDGLERMEFITMGM